MNAVVKPQAPARIRRTFAHPLQQQTFDAVLREAHANGTGLFHHDGRERRGSLQACSFWDGVHNVASIASRLPHSTAFACWHAGRAFASDISKAQQRLVRLPAFFFDDHMERDLDTPAVVKRTRGAVFVALDDPALDELLNDAEFYADPSGPDQCPRGLKHSARMTAMCIKAARA